MLQGDACFRVPKRKNTSVVLIQSFKPTTVSDTRRQIEDYCRDLIINNGRVHLKNFILSCRGTPAKSLCT